MVNKLKTKNMTHVHRFVLVSMVVLMGVTNTLGQVGTTAIDHAVKVLKGIDKEDSKEWAIATLEKAVLSDTSSYAMNCLGIAYMAGLGVDSDSTKAVFWLESAGKHGYADAYHNLGMIYKYSKCGVKQDFKKAYNYYSLGADSGSVDCLYDKGFMLYKGLGCNQSYSMAVKYFRIASKSLHSPSLYMLGLCYRNGYGVEKDTAMALDYLKRSAMLGYRDAVEELARPNAETYLHEAFIEHDIPSNMPQISPKVNDTSLLAGCYHGYLVMYDWSGNYVLGEKPMTMNVVKNGSGIKGTMVIGTDTVFFVANITADNRLLFEKGNLSLKERYTNDGTVKYRFDNMIYDVWDDNISGRLNLYSLKQKEPERPMYFKLQRDGVQCQTQTNVLSNISISPNPFEYHFSMFFELLDDSDVQVTIFNIYGMMVWHQNMSNLNKGKHQVTISPTITSGKYVVNVKAGKQILHSIIIKEGGAQ